MTIPSAEHSLRHCSLRRREEPAGRRQGCHSPEESLLSSQSLSVGHVRTERLVDEFSSLSSCSREHPRRDSENEQVWILFERQLEQILADFRAEIQKHEFQADSDRRRIQKLNGTIESQRGEINRAHARRRTTFDEINFIMNNNWNKKREFREAHVKSLNEMEKLKRFQVSTFDTTSRRRLIEY